MRNEGRTDVAQEKDEINDFENPVLGTPVRKAVFQTKAIVRELNDDVSKFTFYIYKKEYTEV